MGTSARCYGLQGHKCPRHLKGHACLLFLLGFSPIVEEAQLAFTEGMLLALYQALMASFASVYTTVA